MSELVSDLKKKKRIINIGGSLESRKRHISRGKVLPRERIAHLLDDKDNALEIGELAEYLYRKIPDYTKNLENGLLQNPEFIGSDLKRVLIDLR